MATIIRTWKKCHPDTLWSIWDGGNEFWELKNGHIRHFSVIERSREGDLIIEKVLLLPESAIPLEVVRQSILGWEVEEVQVQVQLQQPQPQVQQPQPQPQVQPQVQVQVQMQQLQSQTQPHSQQPQVKNALRRKGAFQPLTQGPAFLPDTPEDASAYPQQQSLYQQPPFSSTQKIVETKKTEASNEEDTESQPFQEFQADPCSQNPGSKEASLQDSYTPPTELWSALSQWIPPNALYQPSLHHQAFLELSGTQEKSYPGKGCSEVNVRHKEARRPYLAQARNSRPYQPKTFVQQPKVAGPLFI